MTLAQWVEAKWAKAEQATPEEIKGLFAIMLRDLNDARATNISQDRRFVSAYECALTICNILLRSSGYRIKAESHHFKIIDSLRHTLPEVTAGDRKFLQDCRMTRNKVTYFEAGLATEGDLNELLKLVLELKTRLIAHLNTSAPHLLPNDYDA